MAWYTRGCLPTKSVSTQRERPSKCFRLAPHLLLTYKERFKTVAKKGSLSLAGIKEHCSALGAGQIELLIDRIFAGINRSATGCATLDEYLEFLETLLCGSDAELAELIVRMVARNPGESITPQSLEVFLQSVSGLGGLACRLPEEYLRAVFALLDKKKDGIIDAEEVRESLPEQPQLWAWLGLIRRKMTDVTEPAVESDSSRLQKILDRLLEVEREVTNCVDLLHPEDSTADRLDTIEGLTPGSSDSSSDCIDDDTSLLPQCPILGDQPVLMASRRTYDRSPRNLSTESTQFRSRNVVGKLQTVVAKVAEVRGLLRGEKEAKPRLDERWNLVVKVLCGMHKSLKSLTIDEELDNSERDFGQKLQHSVLLLPVGSEVSHKVYKFTDYCPAVFERLRLMYGVARSDFISSLSIEKVVEKWLLGSTETVGSIQPSGQNGGFSYLSEDRKFALVTISKEEFLQFRKRLKSYYEHITSRPNSLLTRVYGLYKLIFKRKLRPSRLYFVTVHNPFRQGIHAKSEFPPLVQPLSVSLGDDRSAQLMSILEQDCAYLKTLQACNYKLTVGVQRLASDWQEAQDYLLRFVPFAEMDDGGLLSEDRRKLYFLEISDFLHTDSTLRTEVAKQYADTFLSIASEIIR